MSAPSKARTADLGRAASTGHDQRASRKVTPLAASTPPTRHSAAHTSPPNRVRAPTSRRQPRSDVTLDGELLERSPSRVCRPTPVTADPTRSRESRRSHVTDSDPLRRREPFGGGVIDATPTATWPVCSARSRHIGSSSKADDITSAASQRLRRPIAALAVLSGTRPVVTVHQCRLCPRKRIRVVFTDRSEQRQQRATADRTRPLVHPGDTLAGDLQPRPPTPAPTAALPAPRRARSGHWTRPEDSPPPTCRDDPPDLPTTPTIAALPEMFGVTVVSVRPRQPHQRRNRAAVVG